MIGSEKLPNPRLRLAQFLSGTDQKQGWHTVPPLLLAYPTGF